MIMFGCREDVGKKMKIHKCVLWNNLTLHSCVKHNLYFFNLV